ncbi:MAG: rod shape-determining protein MreC [Candidatus Zambryskibacteria bacterium]|nr:rod shape-determining protein MreC [Candidatus Zambryskibacteria bacterium]
MKMIYPIKRNKKSIWYNKTFRLVSFFLVVLIFAFLIGNIFANSLLTEVLNPFLKTGNFFYKNLNQIPKFFSDKLILIKENQELLEEINQNHLNLVNIIALNYENQRLREELSIKLSGQFLAASIIAKFPQVALDSLILDKGINENIKVGDLVLASDRILIGRIAKSNNNSSTIKLNSFVDVYTYGFVARTNEPIEIKGSGGGNMKANLPIDFDIEVGDEIMIGGSFNFIAAVAGVIDEDRLSGFKNVFMSLPTDIYKLNTVFIYPLNNE